MNQNQVESTPLDKDELISEEEMKETVRRWVGQQRTQLQLKEEQLEHLNAECEKMRRDLNFMEVWLELSEAAGKAPLSGVEKMLAGLITRSGNGLTEQYMNEGSRLGGEDDTSLKGDHLRDAVVDILREYPQGLYYREILRRLQARGCQVGGRDPGLNLIAHITRDKRIERGDKRGVYRLEENFAAINCHDGNSGEWPENEPI